MEQVGLEGNFTKLACTTYETSMDTPTVHIVWSKKNHTFNTQKNAGNWSKVASYHQSNVGDSSSRITGGLDGRATLSIEDGSLNINSLQPWDDAMYRCIHVTRDGRSECLVRLHVAGLFLACILKLHTNFSIYAA